MKEEKKKETGCLYYTSRRRIKETTENSSKNDTERKLENEEEFEEIRLQLQDCLISKYDEKRRKTLSKSCTRPSSVSSSLSSNSHVDVFRKFVEENGGHYGRWKVKDHLFFLKLRSKFPLNKTAETIHQHYPDIRVEEVFKHDSWFNQYSKLRAANKIAIEEWRKRYQINKEQDKKEEPEIQSKTAAIKQNPKIKEKIEIWKAKTLAAKLERLEAQRLEEMKKKRENEEKKKLQDEKKSMLNQYWEEKNSYNMAMKAAEELVNQQAKREAIERAAKLLTYFRNEDRRYSERQKSRMQQKLKEEPKVKPLVQVKRDPSRLLRPTQGWLQRTKRTEPEGVPASSTPMNINHIRKLGKPAWRKSISP